MERMELSGQNVALHAACDRIERAARLLEQLAANGRRGQVPSAEALSTAAALVEGARGQLYGRRPSLPGSGRERILRYLQQHENEVVTGDELARVAGIHAWARRVRELREAGYHIEHLGAGRYVFKSER